MPNFPKIPLAKPLTSPNPYTHAAFDRGAKRSHLRLPVTPSAALKGTARGTRHPTWPINPALSNTQPGLHPFYGRAAAKFRKDNVPELPVQPLGDTDERSLGDVTRLSTLTDPDGPWSDTNVTDSTGTSLPYCSTR